MNYFYTDKTGGVVGPVSREALQKLVDEGLIAPDAQACYEGSEASWEPVKAFVQPSTQKAKAKPIPISSTAVRAVTPPPAGKRVDVPKPGITRSQGYCVIALLFVGLGFPFVSFLKPAPKWEYKKLVFLTDGLHQRTGYGAMSHNSINLDESLLESMGSQGWELATSYLEMETAFPNFGKEDYVTGLQPNIRPQSLVLIFKHPK